MAKRKKKKSKNMKKGTNPHAHKQRIENARSVAKNPSPQSSSQPAAMTQSLAQKRAKYALAQINAIKSYDKYVSYVSALPANIITSGLGQAMAMLKAGKKDGHKFLFDHMQDWLCNKDRKGWVNSPYSNDLLGAIVGGSEDEYIRAQAEAIEYLEWLKKFAVAFLDKEGNSSNQEGDNESSSD